MTTAEYLSKLNLTISTLPNFHHWLIPDWRDFPNDQSFLGLCSNYLHEVKTLIQRLKISIYFKSDFTPHLQILHKATISYIFTIW